MKLSTFSIVTTKAVACSLLMLALAVTMTHVVNGEKIIIVNCRVMIHLCVMIMYSSPPFCLIHSTLTSFYTLLVFFCLNVPAQSCVTNCHKAVEICCSPRGIKCRDQATNNKCKNEMYACAAKCKATTDFDVDIEGAVVDEA
jgi:hypothetical protein